MAIGRPDIGPDLLREAMARWPVEDGDKQTAGLATATLAVPGTKWRNNVLKVEASYSDPAESGLLQIKSGTTVFFEKYVHGTTAIDWSEFFGRPADALNETMSAELEAGGVGVVGTVQILGYKNYET